MDDVAVVVAVAVTVTVSVAVVVAVAVTVSVAVVVAVRVVVGVVVGVGVGDAAAVTVFIDTWPVYEYEHNGRTWYIEVPPIGGPVPLKANGEPYQRIPREFWEVLEAWRKTGQ